MLSDAVELSALLEVATRAARAAGADVRTRLGLPRTVDAKGYRDIVTDADVAAQGIIVKTIRDAFPNHGYLVEEADPSLATSGPIVWIVDPVDGTTNYSRGIPLFCVSIAAVAADPAGGFRPLAVAVYDPLRDELFNAAAGQGARLNGAPLQVSRVATPAEAVFALDFGHSDSVRADSVAQVGRLAAEVTTIRAFGSAVLGLAWVAAGRLDAYLNYALLPWDYAAGWLLIEEAGGTFTLLDSPPRLDRQSYPGLGSNRLLCSALRTALGHKA